MDISVAGLAVVQLMVASLTLASVRRQMEKTAPVPAIDDEGRDVAQLSDKHLPTITVAVPVRDEDGQLKACLTSVLASNYPKLEVLAFDDDSHDRTPDIIRSFAHAGVRFLRTSEPKAGWLDKNRAYDELAAAASGEYILFCGADIRLGVWSLRRLAAQVQVRKKSMIAVLPQNRGVGHVPLLQAMRYYWEMAPPRRLFNRPPVLSSCWMIRREALQKAGGFAAVRKSLSPEAHMARWVAADHDGYAFIRSDEELGITSEKPVRDQRSTALLRRYPQLHRRPLMVLAVSLIEILLLLAPYAFLVLAVTVLSSSLVASYIALISGLAIFLNSIAFGMIQHAAFPQVSLIRCCLAFPASIASDIWYLYRSMWHYEFGDVTWKKREVKRVVMQRK